MTVIAAIVKDNTIYMGGDRGYSDSHIISSSTQPKIFEIGSYLIGYAGNSGVAQSVIHNFEFPAVGKTTNINKHMHKVFIPALRSFFTDNNIKLPDGDDDGTGFIVGLKGRLYEIDLSDFQCVEYSEVSIGSGSSYAYGSLYTSIDKDPIERIGLALGSAITYSPTCQGPMDILSL